MFFRLQCFSRIYEVEDIVNKHFTSYHIMATKFPLLEVMDFSTIVHTEPTKNKEGGIPIAYSNISKTNRNHVIFQLCMPAPELFDKNTPADVRETLLSKVPYIRSGFHLQPVPKYGKDGKHTILMGVTDEIAAMVRRLDEKNISDCAESAKKWLKKPLSADQVRTNYTSLISRYPTADEVDESAKVTVVRAKMSEKLSDTQILVQSADKYNDLYEGDFRDLKMGCRVVPLLQDNGIYIQQNGTGGQLFAKRFIILHGNRVEDDAEMDIGDVHINIVERFVPSAVERDGTVTDQTVVGSGGGGGDNYAMVNGKYPQSMDGNDEDFGPAVAY